MRKGQKKRIWTPAQKKEIVQKYSEEHIVGVDACIDPRADVGIRPYDSTSQ